MPIVQELSGKMVAAAKGAVDPPPPSTDPKAQGPRASEPSPGGACGTYAPKDLRVSVEQILRLQGYTDLSRVRPAVRNAAETVTIMANRMLAADARYRRVSIADCAGGVLTLVDGTRLHCDAFDRCLSGCREIIAFVLTLGRGFDQVGSNLSASKQVLESLFLETVGWMAIEQATKRLLRHLGETVGPERLVLTRRMAPGYSFSVGGGKCDWSLLEQSALFGMFRDVELPVRLLESGGMVPKMSRSGLYGLRPKPAEAP
jgi:hypothetical protein